MADKYNFNLPCEKEDEELNIIFIAAIQFIDMLYFENNYLASGSI
jgi:hypothetical protein